ncbi:glycosyltransferase [Pseudanabaena sp. FACHB-2040]|uniref:glycosyltransferase n=1 Tax=Pseudanabaena sp. FACHB-2040 TaxID=2692859 RepID=UPI001685125C|nr:glycosyltransferase [Pseudanabaena sp. FACHB-2040]MBD2260790.1 glycosyltransferase [Pseudanabaena sp. FACHB-2040]
MNHPFRIGLIYQGGRNWIGGSMYVKNIILALASLPDQVKSTFDICLLYNDALDAATRQELEPHISQFYDLEQEVKPITLKNRLIWKFEKEVFRQPNPPFNPVMKKGKIDFLYPTSAPTREPFALRSCPWIPDFQHKYLPHLFSEAEIERRDREHSAIARHSTRVVLSSKAAESDFKKFFPTSQTRTEVLQFRTSPASSWFSAHPEEIQKKYCLPERFFLFSGQFWQHKNHLVVLEALQELRSQGIQPTVVCTGHIYDDRKPEYLDLILQKIHTYGLSQQFLVLGLISRSDQIQLMRRSIAVLQPSLFEGWSTVVEDARCLGKPMILSDFPVHVEQNPLGCVFFGRSNFMELANILAKGWQTLSSGPNLEQEQLARAQNKKDIRFFGHRFLEIARGETKL